MAFNYRIPVRTTVQQYEKTANVVKLTSLNLRSRSATKPIVHLLSSVFVLLSTVLAVLPSCSAFAQLFVPAVKVAPAPASPTLTIFEQKDAFTPIDPGSIDPEDHRGIVPATEADLPDAPGRAQIAPIHTKYIAADFTAQPVKARDKVLLGLRDLYTPIAFAGFLASAAYGQVLNGQPNYGTDRGAFGARLGAAAIGATAEGVFTDTVFAPLLHEDPRYYVEGPQYGLVHRTVYAATRPLITRTDSGRSSPNGALLLGYAAAAALSLTYYPQSNRNFRDAVATFGGSIGGESLDYVLREFSTDVLTRLHLTTRD